MTTENFGATPDDFDIDEWIEQGSRPRRTVTIYRDWSLLEEYERLAAQLPADADAAAPDESMADEGVESVRAAMTDVIERMEASALEITMQALTQQEVKALAEAAPTKPMLDASGDPVLDAKGSPRTRVDEVALGDMLAAEATISPKLTADQLGRMRVKLGDGPVHPIYKAAQELRVKGQELPAIPSSREH